MSEPVFVPLPERHDPGQPAEAAAKAFCEVMAKRRTVREFSDRPVSRETIEWIVRAAGTAPSGANKQPWRFACISDPALKREIRLAAEKEEREFYESRASEGWLEDLAPLGTDPNKEFLEIAPWLVVLFERRYGVGPGGEKRTHYYVKESAGIAAGMFVTAIHHMGLATLPHTPSPMAFLRQILGRPENERPFVMFPVGHPLPGVKVPDLHRKSLDQVAVFFDEDSDGPAQPLE
jgi:iodotyrosine deiodinase